MEAHPAPSLGQQQGNAVPTSVCQRPVTAATARQFLVYHSSSQLKPLLFKTTIVNSTPRREAYLCVGTGDGPRASVTGWQPVVSAENTAKVRRSRPNNKVSDQTGSSLADFSIAASEVNVHAFSSRLRPGLILITGSSQRNSIGSPDLNHRGTNALNWMKSGEEYRRSVSRLEI